MPSEFPQNQRICTNKHIATDIDFPSATFPMHIWFHILEYEIRYIVSDKFHTGCNNYIVSKGNQMRLRIEIHNVEVAMVSLCLKIMVFFRPMRTLKPISEKQLEHYPPP